MANPLTTTDEAFGNVEALKTNPYSNAPTKDSEIPKINNGTGNNAGYLNNQQSDPFVGKTNMVGKTVMVGK